MKRNEHVGMSNSDGYYLINLGHTLYILYHLTFVVIVWLYAIRNYGPYGFCLGTGWQNYFKTTDKK